MLRLDRFAKHCAQLQLPLFAAQHTFTARDIAAMASRRTVSSSMPEEQRLQQAQLAFEALGSMQQQMVQQQQGGVAAAIPGR